MKFNKSHINPEHFKYGVYAYVSPELNEAGNNPVVYIGYDKHIDEDRRHTEHLKPAKKDAQLINQKIREEHLVYQVLAISLDKQTAYALETTLINLHNPKYNSKARKNDVSTLTRDELIALNISIQTKYDNLRTRIRKEKQDGK